MNLPRTLALAGLAGLALGLAAAWLFRPGSPESVTAAVDVLGSPRPDFVLTDRAGRPSSISEYDGRPVLINFWATWCPPCIREMPLLQELADARADALTVLGIAIDEPEAARVFLDRLQIRYPNLLAGNQGDSIQAAFGNPGRMLPYSILVDAQGIIRWHHLGALDQTLIDTALPQAGVE